MRCPVEVATAVVKSLTCQQDMRVGSASIPFTRATSATPDRVGNP
jgi:hypothetical protein